MNFHFWISIFSVAKHFTLSVQEQVEDMKKKEERMEKQMNEVMAENKRLVEPLQKAKEEVEELRRQLANYEKDKQSLAVSKCSSILFSAHIFTYCKSLIFSEFSVFDLNAKLKGR